MGARVGRDTTVRTIHIFIQAGSVPDLDITRSWHPKPRIIPPTSAMIGILDGQTKSINVTGGVILKSGVMSARTSDTQTYAVGRYSYHDRIESAPQWARQLCEEALNGVTVWEGVPE
jgi:hypothetical protein